MSPIAHNILRLMARARPQVIVSGLLHRVLAFLAIHILTCTSYRGQGHTKRLLPRREGW